MSTQVAEAPKTTSQPIDFTLRQRGMDLALKTGLCWAVMFGAGECFFSIFATRIHAPAYFFGLMTGLPSLLGPISQLYGADAVDRTGHRKRISLTSVTIQALCFGPLAVLPFLGEGDRTNLLLLGIMLIYFAGAHFCIPAWNSWLSVLVPTEERGFYFARLSRAREFTSLISKLAAGFIMFLVGRYFTERPEWAMSMFFAGTFLASGIARFGSFLCIQKMYQPPYEHSPEAQFTFWQFIGRIRESNFVRFVLFVTTIYFGALIAGPFFVPYTIYTLHYEPWQWVVLESCGAVTSITTVIFWASFSHRFGNKRTLQYTSVMISMIPMLWLVNTNFYFLMAVNCLSGFSWAGFNLCWFNYILEAVTPPKRARCLAYFNLLVGIGSFCGSMLGGLLYKTLPTTTSIFGQTITVSSPFIYLLLLSCTCRLGLSLISVGAFKELRKVESFELGDLFDYVAEIRFPMGVRMRAYNEAPKKPEVEKKD